MGRVEVFAKIPMNGSVRGGLHAISSGADFCIATCQDQVGYLDLTWFHRSAEQAENGHPSHIDTTSTTSQTSSSPNNSHSVA